MNLYPAFHCFQNGETKTMYALIDIRKLVTSQFIIEKPDSLINRSIKLHYEIVSNRVWFFSSRLPKHILIEMRTTGRGIAV